MLVLGRKRKEEVLIGDLTDGVGQMTVRIRILRIRRGEVRIGIEAPAWMKVLRAELLDSEDGSA